MPSHPNTCVSHEKREKTQTWPSLRPPPYYQGWLLDGYPRSADQADAIAAEGINPDVFLLLDVPDEILIERVVGRRLDPETGTIYHMKFFPPPEDIVDRLTQRSDDTEEKAKNRLSVHHSNVDAVVGGACRVAMQSLT